MRALVLICVLLAAGCAGGADGVDEAESEQGASNFQYNWGDMRATLGKELRHFLGPFEQRLIEGDQTAFLESASGTVRLMSAVISGLSGFSSKRDGIMRQAQTSGDHRLMEALLALDRVMSETKASAEAWKTPVLLGIGRAIQAVGPLRTTGLSAELIAALDSSTWEAGRLAFVTAMAAVVKPVVDDLDPLVAAEWFPNQDFGALVARLNAWLVALEARDVAALQRLAELPRLKGSRTPSPVVADD